MDTSIRYLSGSDIFEDEEITPELAELIARSNLYPPVKAVETNKTLSDYKITKESTILLSIQFVRDSLQILTSFIVLKLRGGDPTKRKPNGEQLVLNIESDKGQEQVKFPAYYTLGDVKQLISGISWTQQRLVTKNSNSVIEDGWTLHKLLPMKPFNFHLSMPRSLCIA